MAGRCLLNVGLPDEDLIIDFCNLHEDFKIFAQNEELPSSITLAMLIRYMVHCYDRNSAIVMQHKSEWIIKKKNSAIKAGFPLIKIDGSEKFISECEDIIFNKRASLNNVIVRYLALEFDNDFAMLSIYSEMYYNVMKDLQAYKFDKSIDFERLKKMAESIKDDIDRLDYKIFSGGEEREMKNVLYAFAYKRSLELRPESLISKKENGEPLVDINPYGDGYKVDKMKFLGDE